MGFQTEQSPWRAQVDKAAAVTVVIAILLLPFSVLTTCFAAEIIVGLRELARPSRENTSTCRAVVVVPAHDEAEGLAARLEALTSAAASAGARVLLVADNCTDSTAQIATKEGAQVIERNDFARRGKGFALDFARKHLESNPPEVVVIIDADCSVDPPGLTALIAACAATGRPCQATNLQRPALNASPAVQLSTFAFFIKNVIRQRALQRLAGRAHLLGTGMALPWSIFSNAQLATGNIVEDLALGQELSDAGHAPLFVEDATVWSRAETETNTLSQRQRWEGGFLQNATRVGPAMLVRSLARADLRGLWAAMNAMIPPFALLLLLDFAALSVAAALTIATKSSALPLLLLCAALGFALFALALAWRAGGSRFVGLSGLARLPLYLLWKLPMYLAFARHGAPKEWQRTSRS